MKKVRLTGPAWAGVLALSACSANAVTITTVVDNLADNLFVASGATINGLFDITALLAGNEIVSASFSVIAFDDGDRLFTHETFGPYAYAYSLGGREKWFRDNNRYFTDAAESSVVSFEGTTEAITESAYYSFSNASRGSVFESSTNNHCHRSGFFGCTYHKPHDYHKSFKDTESGYTGALNSSGLLGEAEIQSAMVDGLINFSVASASGDFILNSVSLTLETAPVPVPAAVWLFGSGLLGLAGIARRNA